MKKPLLSLKNISFQPPSRSTPILHDLSLDIFPNDFIILLGSNGSGKSSLIQIINGLNRHNQGDILFQGKDLTNDSLSQRALSIATLTQDLNLTTFSQLSVLENCLIALQRKKRVSFAVSTTKEKKQILEVLAQYNPTLCDRIDEPLSTLSGGERQTLAFAMSVWSQPTLLLLDEHTSALDPAMSEKLIQMTVSIALEREIATLMTTHNLTDALRYGNRLIAMREGKIILDVAGKEKQALSYEHLRSTVYEKESKLQ